MHSESEKLFMLLSYTHNGVFDQTGFDREWGIFIARRHYKSEKLLLAVLSLGVITTLWCFITFGEWWLFAFLIIFYSLFRYQLRDVRKAKAKLWWRTLTGISHG